MVTMMKEKVNTHFSFPLRLDMTPYTEDFLMGKNDRKEGMSHKMNAPGFVSFVCVLLLYTLHIQTICDFLFKKIKSTGSFIQPIFPN